VFVGTAASRRVKRALPAATAAPLLAPSAPSQDPIDIGLLRRVEVTSSKSIINVIYVVSSAKLLFLVNGFGQRHTVMLIAFHSKL
jgi:hypothetical protein